MASQVVVGVDFGSSRIKAAAYDAAGEMVALEARETPVVRGAAGDDFPVLDLLAAAHDAVAALRAGPVAAVGLTSMGETGTVVTPDGLAPLDFPAWYDDRGADVATALEDRFGATHLRDLTARHFRTTSTVTKLAHAHASRGCVPPGAFVGLCGALAFQLTGEVWQEAGLATTSGVYDLLERRYLSDAWVAAGLGHVTLAPVRPPGFGAPADGELARSLGLSPGARVVIAGHDHPVAAVGSGVRVGEVFDSMGTGEAIIAALPTDPPLTRAQLVAHLDRDTDLTFELWPSTGAPLAVWERMRPGLAMRTFLDGADLDRQALDDGAGPPSATPDLTAADLGALQEGRSAVGPRDAHAWGDLMDAYVLLANEGEALARAVSGAAGATVLTGGGLRSRRWREAKLALGPRAIEVSTVPEAATRGCAAVAGASIGWWSGAEEMPGRTRVPVRSSREMDAAVGATS
ncbi:FGGY family carbohydrate kinase [Serinibacter arcticus]|uniref:Xylulose kinase n=1 Tax=Serinibacter arcticus TaxID=1655435 RepID=A0A4Z1E3S7_9MICO|nr:FGGY family carbohydrate kinase [Serinibacter arcticus]TGO05123.1 Xylulose kinase [Serinibacter arcticus]